MSVLGYWDITGLAEPIRLLLAYLNVEYTNKLYHHEGQEWFNEDKSKIGLNFPNIPYYIDGETKVTQSSAIPYYIIKKNKRNDLLGQNSDGSYNEQEIRVQEVQGVIRDIRAPLISICFNEEVFKQKDVTYNEKILPLLNRLIAYLGKKDFLVETLTYADFTFYDTIVLINTLFPQSIHEVTNDYIKRFENLEGIKQYKATPHSYDNYFFNKKWAIWAGPAQN